MESKSFKRYSVMSATYVAAAILAATSVRAEPKTVYRETFGYCSGSLGKPAADQASWMGLISGHKKERISNLKVFSYGISDIGGSVNSNPIGLAQGYSFWWKAVYGLAVFTTEFQFDVGLLKDAATTIEYRQRLSGVDPNLQPNKTHLAIRVDDTWYISNEFVQQVKPGSWESVTVTPALLNYGTVAAIDGVGPETPTTFGVPLPAAGIVKSFGVFMDEVNGRIRFDNFTIKAELPRGSQISTTGQEPEVSSCPSDSPDRTGTPDSTPTPDPDDGDAGVDHEIPDTPTPTPTPAPHTPEVHAHDVAYQFCPVRQQGRGRSVVLSKKARSALIRTTSQGSSQDLRDRAILSLLAQRTMPLGALVNSKLGDLNVLGGSVTLVTRAGSKPTKLRLRGSTGRAFQDYLATLNAPKDILAPLFVNSTISGGYVVTQKALCSSDLAAMLKGRAKLAKISIPGIYRASSRR